MYICIVHSVAIILLQVDTHTMTEGGEGRGGEGRGGEGREAHRL